VLTSTLQELREAFGADSSASGEAVSTGGDWLSIDEYTPDKIVARTEIADEHTRKGGTVAGATIFRFFDAIGYLVTFAQSPNRRRAPKGSPPMCRSTSFALRRSGRF
jgi:acyl-coenzyme A thioesterase PaaI-like protein